MKGRRSDVPRLVPARGGFRVRLRYGQGQQARFTIALTDEAAARQRARRLVELAQLLVAAGRHAEAPIILEEGAGETTESGFRYIERRAAELCKDSPKAAQQAASLKVTVQQLGEQWTSGELHRKYPDQIPLKRTAADDAGRLAKYVYPAIGNKPVRDITLDDCERIMRELPESVARSRSHVAATIARLLKLAVYPLRLLDRSPLPDGFVPKRRKTRALAWLYPDEDRRLMACGAVPLRYRLLWGFLAREGMREGEALNLTWSDLDLQRGMVRLDKNKTDDPRAWALNAGTTAALRIYRTHFCSSSAPNALVFVTPGGAAHSKYGLADTLRSHLERIGLKVERPELFTTTGERQRIRVHDLRGTFVTIALANGRSESWIADRTGHRSSMMINRYKRTARSFQELGLGELRPLNEAIPEFALSHEVSQRAEILNENWRPQRDLNPERGSSDVRQSTIHAAAAAPVVLEQHGDSPLIAQGESAQTAPADPIERALASALEAATAASRWDVVSQVAAELEARRRVLAGVVSLDARRGKHAKGAS
jgi:integrase